jgi:hypothetical protein
MKKLVTGMALAVACLVPLSAAKAVDFCTSGLALNFCGSVSVSITPSGSGSLVTLTVFNYSGSSLGGDPAAVFTSIALTDVPNIGTLSGLSVVSGGIDYVVGPAGDPGPHWALTTNVQQGGGVVVAIDASTIPGSTIQYGISSACSGANRIDTGGIGTCGFAANSVVISFHSTTSGLTAGDVFVKAQGINSSECDYNISTGVGSPTGCGGGTTTVPEPATLTLFGTGLIALGSRVKRWRRRNDNV